jgi:hypothetical protein
LTGFAIDDATHVSGDTEPHSPGIVQVTVTNAFGVSLPLYNAFEYIAVGTVPVVTAVSYDVVDTAGGGARIVVTVDSSTGCTGITAGGVAFTSFAIDDATHVSGVPGAHASGVVDVVVSNATGPSTTGTGLIEYFTPLDLTPTLALMPGDYAVVGTQGVDAVGTWQDSSGNNNDAVSAGGVNAPAAHASGVPDFVAANSLYLSIAQSLASAGGVPPDLGTLGAGTQINFFEPDLSSGAEDAGAYNDAVVSCGNGASAGITYSDAGISWEAYDEGAFANYRRPTSVAAAPGGKHFAAGRWNGTTWGCFVNGSAEGTVTSDSAVLSNGNVGAATEIGRSFGGARYLDGRVHCMLVYPTAISDANVTKIRKWGQQSEVALVGSVAVVSAVNHGRVDIAGGGQRVVVTVNSSVGCSAITAGGVAFTSFAIDDATHVSGVPGAHAAGVVDVVVTNLGGLSTGGTGLIEYWSPLQITGVTRYFDSNKGVTDAGAGKVSSWVDQTGAADDATQATGANQPTQTASVFGTMPSIKFTPEQWLDATGEATMTPWSIFSIMKTVSAAAVGGATTPAFNVAQCILGGSGWSSFGVDGGTVAVKVFDVALETFTGAVNDGTAHLIGVTDDGTPSRQGYVDGSAAGAPSALAGDENFYWDHIGDGVGNVDGFDGDIGAIITLGATVISGGDLTALNEWSQQRFGTP